MRDVRDRRTPEQLSCKAAVWFTDQDSCQAHDYIRCKTCGSAEGQGCSLSEDTIANLLQKQSLERIAVTERFKQAKALAKELVMAERERQGKVTERTIEAEIEKRVGRKFMVRGAWQTLMTICTIIVALDIAFKFFKH